MLHSGGAFARAARLKCGEAHEVGRFLIERGGFVVLRFVGGQCLLHFHASAQGIRCFQQQGFRIYFPRSEQTLYFRCGEHGHEQAERRHFAQLCPLRHVATYFDNVFEVFRDTKTFHFK